MPPLGEDVGFVECPDGVVQDWDIGGAGVDHIRTYWTPSEGFHSIDLSRRGAGSVSQLIPTTTGGTYTVSFDMAGNPECGPAEKMLMVQWGDQPAFGPYSYTTTGYPVCRARGMADGDPGKPSGKRGRDQLTFEDVSTPSSACGVALDNIVVTSRELVPVPEFPSLALTGGVFHRDPWCGVLYQVFPGTVTFFQS